VKKRFTAKWIILLKGAHMVKVNGEELDVAGKTITQFLDEANYNTDRIVVERNMEIVPKDQYNNVTFEDGDSVEVVSFVGGG